MLFVEELLCPRFVWIFVADAFGFGGVLLGSFVHLYSVQYVMPPATEFFRRNKVM